MADFCFDRISTDTTIDRLYGDPGPTSSKHRWHPYANANTANLITAHNVTFHPKARF
ncbi:hypothetical protein [uncultured Sulfitobacter sp.]|uniref:hypothetical protein n=1 Tax=uncultured Sulfitobacter sp. TaxID=191468 RepID=UPI00260F805F|nr:hypothetical protein [uncultured Sulfitobacter sp.]